MTGQCSVLIAMAVLLNPAALPAAVMVNSVETLKAAIDHADVSIGVLHSDGARIYNNTVWQAHSNYFAAIKNFESRNVTMANNLVHRLRRPPPASRQSHRHRGG